MCTVVRTAHTCTHVICAQKMKANSQVAIHWAKCLVCNPGLLLLFALWMILSGKCSSFVLEIMYYMLSGLSYRGISFYKKMDKLRFCYSPVSYLGGDFLHMLGVQLQVPLPTKHSRITGKPLYRLKYTLHRLRHIYMYTEWDGHIVFVASLLSHALLVWLIIATDIG